MDDDSGQFLLLTAVVVAVGLVVLLVYINQSSMSGYSSAESIINFPKDNIRDFRAETIINAQHIAAAENGIVNIENGSPADGPIRQNGFNTNFSSSINDIKKLYAQRGVAIDVQCNDIEYDPNAIPEYQKLLNATLIINYNDGGTLYNEKYVVDFEGYQ
jgi:hypothetical protein